MLSDKYVGSGAIKLRSIKAAGGRRGWPKLRAEALRIAGEGVRQALRSAKAGEVFYPRIDGPKNIAEADEFIASQGHFENARGVTIEISLRTGDPRIDKKAVGSHYAPIGNVFARDLAAQAREARSPDGWLYPREQGASGPEAAAETGRASGPQAAHRGGRRTLITGRLLGGPGARPRRPPQFLRA